MSQIYLRDFNAESDGALTGIQNVGVDTYTVASAAALEGAKGVSVGSGSTGHDWFYDTTTTPSVGDYEVEMMLKSPNYAGDRFGPVGRAYNNGGTHTAYAGIIRNYNTMRLIYLLNAVESAVKSEVSITAISESVTYKVKLHLNGNDRKVRYWDASGSEPATWSIETSDTTIDNTHMGVGCYGYIGNSNTNYWDRLVVNDFITLVTYTKTVEANLELHQFVELFNATTYKDTGNTTGNWDTTKGEATLPRDT